MQYSDSTTDNLDAANLATVFTEKQLQSTANVNDNAVANRKSSAYGRVESAQERSMTLLKADKSGSWNSSFYQEDRDNWPILETLILNIRAGENKIEDAAE